jgi:phosphohistidine phosphatase
MIRLMLLRHAKSSWDDSGIADHDRPLNLRGRAAASLIGRHMADHALVPDRIVCSTARRTRETFAGLLPHFTTDFDAMVLRAVYETETGYLPLALAYGGDARSLLVIGHNPAIQATALDLIGSGNPALTAEIAEKFPTAGLAVIDIPVASWRDIRPGAGRVVAFFRPRELEVVDADPAAQTDD